MSEFLFLIGGIILGGIVIIFLLNKVIDELNCKHEAKMSKEMNVIKQMAEKSPHNKTIMVNKEWWDMLSKTNKY